MIQWMHQLSKSWVATLLMGGLALSFVVWGIADVFTGSVQHGAGDGGIDRDFEPRNSPRTYRNFLRNQGQQMGMELTPEMAQKMGLDRRSLQQMIGRTALDNDAARPGSDHHATPNWPSRCARCPPSRAPPANSTTMSFCRSSQVPAIPSRAFLEANAPRPGARPAHHRHGSRLRHARKPIPAALFRLSGRTARRRLCDRLAGIGGRHRAARATRCWRIMSRRMPTISPRPEYREIEYAEVAPQDVVGQVTVTDKMIADEFKAHEANYNVPEKRDIQQIEFASEADARAARDQHRRRHKFRSASRRSARSSPTDLSTGHLGQGGYCPISRAPTPPSRCR